VSERGTRTYVVPGRVELVGKHVDYAGGRSITCAVDRGITATSSGPFSGSSTRVLGGMGHRVAAFG